MIFVQTFVIVDSLGKGIFDRKKNLKMTEHPDVSPRKLTAENKVEFIINKFQEMYVKSADPIEKVSHFVLILGIKLILKLSELIEFWLFNS